MTEQEKVQPDMRLEVVVIGVSDVGRAKTFYKNLGWRLDFDATDRSRKSDDRGKAGFLICT